MNIQTCSEVGNGFLSLYQFSNHVYLEGTVAKHPVDRIETLSNKMMHRVKWKV